MYIPLPPSPVPPTPEASMRLSITTPRGTTPSIRSVIETVPSEAPSHILTHDVNRLLQYLNDINEARGAENRDMAENIQDIKGTLEDLGALLRERMLPEQPPPVPHKDVSVGKSVVSDVSSRGRPKEGPRVMRAISISPPPSRRERSPDTLSETMSLPKIEPEPAVGRASPSSSFMVVVFPAPFGPKKPKIEFSRTQRSSGFNAATEP